MSLSETWQRGGKFIQLNELLNIGKLRLAPPPNRRGRLAVAPQE